MKIPAEKPSNQLIAKPIPSKPKHQQQDANEKKGNNSRDSQVDIISCALHLSAVVAYFMERASTISGCAVVSRTVAAVVVPETGSHRKSVRGDERDIRAGYSAIFEGELDEGAASAFVAAASGLKVAKVR